MKQSAIAIET